MLWINEVEMVGSLDELKSSRSVFGKDFPNFEMPDAKIAAALDKIIQILSSKRRSASRNRKSKKRTGFCERDIAFMICDNFRVTGARDAVLDYADLFSVTLHDDNIQEFETRWEEVKNYIR